MPVRGRKQTGTRSDRPAPHPAVARAVLETLEGRTLFAQSVWAYPGLDGKLLYKPLPLGDKIQDFTNVGYKAGLETIPDVPVKVTVSPVAGDDQVNIQNAINAVAAMPLDPNGFRGAVLLNPGTYEIPGTLVINTSGIVLRGSGQGQTILLATGTEKDTTVQLDGNGARTIVGSRLQITDDYVPVGAISFSVADASTFAVGDSVIVQRLATSQWLHDIGADQVVSPWTSRTIDMDRTITRIEGNVITLDAPLTHALDRVRPYGGGTIGKYTATGRISNVGVEYISGRSTFDATLLSGSDRIDENHAEHFIGVDGVINGWVRNITSEFYGYSAVNMTGPSKWVTVQDSQCLDPVSVVTGGRRYSFNMGDSTNVLWKNLYTRSGRHDYVQGSEVTGPNVVVDSRADAARADVGPHHRYSTGTLWDNLDVNGNAINIQNRWNSGTGHGWAGANQVVWNSEANSFIIQNVGSPNTSWNWAVGNVGTKQTGDFVAPDGTVVGSDGLYDSHGTRVDTRSLFHAQMAEKLAYDGWMLRESRIGDGDNYRAGQAADAVAVDAAWRAAVEGATGRSAIGFDVVANNQLVPFTFNFGVAPGTYIVGASLSLGLKSAGNSSAADTIFFESAGRRYTWAELGAAAPTTAQGAVVIDLSKLLAALQDGRLNLAVSGNTAIDWATLNFQTASITSARQQTITAAEDAYVNQASPTSNFGNDASLFTKRNGTTDNRESYLKFDLSGVSGTITNAYVRLVPTAVGVAPSTVSTTFGNATGAILSRVSRVQNNAWTEGSINWNNKPAADPYFREFIAAPNEPLMIDVTAMARAVQGGADKRLSLLLSTYIDNAASQDTYASSESGTVALRPQLVIETLEAVGTVADSTVRGGASANVNHGTLPTLEVKNDSSASADNDREAYLRFDLNGLSGAPGNAFLRLMPTIVPAGTFQHSGQFVADDGWGETGITWNNKPAGSTVLGTWRPLLGQYANLNVTPIAATEYGTADRLLSLKLLSDTASSAAQVQYASRENGAEMFRPMLISSNVVPQITPIPTIRTNVNTPVSGAWFGIWDGETALSSLTVSATASNPALLPLANIAFGGSGGDRTVSLTPAAGQSGTSNVTITVTDAQGATSQATFQFIVDATTAINGDGTDELFRVARNGANVNVFRNGVLIIDVPQSTTNAYTINALGGADTFIIDYSAGNPVPAGGLSVDGGAGVDGLRVIGSSGADSVALPTGSVSFAGSGQFGYVAAESLELQLGAGADTLAVAGAASVTTNALWLNLGGGGSLAMTALSAPGILPDFTDLTIAAGTTFNLGGQNQSIDALDGAGTVVNSGSAAGILTVGSHGSSSTFAGTLANGTQTLSLTKVGAGTLVLGGNNAYTGASTLAGGVLEAANAASFAGLAGVVQFLGGTFRPTATQDAAAVTNKWTTTFVGATGTNTGTFDVPAGVTFTIRGAGTGAAWRTGGSDAGGSFVKSGAGTLRVLTNSGQQDDPILLNQGMLVAESPLALGGIGGQRVDMKSSTTLVLKGDTDVNFETPVRAVDAGGTINVVVDRLTAGAGVAHSLNALTSTGAFTLNLSKGANVTSGVGNLALGAATLGGNATLGVEGNAVLNVTGAIGGGAFGLTKSGSGTLLLNGVNTYTGDTIVTSGPLGGNGTIAGNLISSGNIRPGNSPGILTINGGLTASDVSGSLDFELNGPTPGAEYDRVAVTGAVALGATLNVTLNFAAPTGQVFTIIDSAGTDAVVGTFAGKGEGSTIVAGGRALRVSYVGGDGNDVTVTVIPPPAVTEVFVSGSTWTSGYRSYLQREGFGDATYGYGILPGQQTDELPWVNLDRISIRFSDAVNVAADDLSVWGINVPNYVTARGFAFAYDTATSTASWTLLNGAFFDTDKILLDLDADPGTGVTDTSGVPLDGEWTNPAAAGSTSTTDTFPSGDSNPGGDFRFRLNVLPGDVNRSGGILGNDVTFVRNAQGFAPGTGLYDTPYLDVNGSGGILGNDVTFVRNRQGFTLPAGEPAPPAPLRAKPSPVKAAKFSTASISPFVTTARIRSNELLFAPRFDLLGEETKALLLA